MIHFETEETPQPNIDTQLYSRWIERVIGTFGYHTGRVNYLFCNDDKILDINRQFLQHDYYTDIITFDYTKKNTISGDLFISIDTVATNAKANKTTYKQELDRVIIHGILHLCGKNDKTEIEKKEMRATEDKALQLLEKIAQKNLKKQKNEQNS